MNEIPIGQKTLESCKWELEAGWYQNSLPRKKRKGKCLERVAQSKGPLQMSPPRPIQSCYFKADLIGSTGPLKGIKLSRLGAPSMPGGHCYMGPTIHSSFMGVDNDGASTSFSGGAMGLPSPRLTDSYRFHHTKNSCKTANRLPMSRAGYR